MAGKFVADFPFIVLYSWAFTLAFFAAASPQAPFADFYVNLLLLELTLFGMGAVCSVMLREENALLLSAVASLVAGLGSDKQDGSKNACWGSWYAEAAFANEVRLDLQPPAVHSLIRSYSLLQHGFDLDNRAQDIWVLVCFCLVMRLLAYVILRYKTARLTSSGFGALACVRAVQACKES